MLITGLMGFKPVVTEAGVGNEGNGHVEGVLHLFDDDMLYFFFLVRIDAEVEFVVYLQNHFGTNAFCLKTLEDMNHCHLDDVGSSTLDGRIDGITLGKASHHTIG